MANEDPMDAPPASPGDHFSVSLRWGDPGEAAPEAAAVVPPADPAATNGTEPYRDVAHDEPEAPARIEMVLSAVGELREQVAGLERRLANATAAEAVVEEIRALRAELVRAASMPSLLPDTETSDRVGVASDTAHLLQEVLRGMATLHDDLVALKRRTALRAEQGGAGPAEQAEEIARQVADRLVLAEQVRRRRR